MQTSVDCIPCFLRQSLEMARSITDDPIIHERVARDTLRTMAEVDLSHPPPRVAQIIHQRLRELSGNADPYRSAKDRANQTALALLPEARVRVAESAHPFESALRFAVAANVIDLGAKCELNASEIRAEIENAASVPLVGDVEELQVAVAAANGILYLTDNAGEIVFDRLLLEHLPADKVTVAVRGAPVINDATIEDARSAGIFDAAAAVIDNGSDAPGTVLSDCSEEFVRRFSAADLVIAKGQGNFESLHNEVRVHEHNRLFYLFRVKCSVIARSVCLPPGSHVLFHEGGR